MRITNVARASLEELLIDYQDFLRTKNMKEWEKESKYVNRLRELNRDPKANYETFRKGIESPDAEVSANVILGLIKINSYLLARQIKSLEAAFLKDGGLREKMIRARLERRGR